MKRIFRSFLFSVAMLFCVQSYAQHNTTSPYSMFGVGEIENSAYGMNAGMAGTGIGLYFPGFLNIANPAALGIDSLSFIFDVSTAAKLSLFSAAGQTERGTSANIKKIALGFRAYQKLNLSAGVMPYSNVEYKLKTGEFVEGTNVPYDVTSTGDGGLTQVYLGGTYKLSPKFNVGVKASYLFGTIHDIQTSWAQTRTIESTAQKFLLNFGALYNNQINEQTILTVGAVYNYKTKLTLNNTRTVSINNVTENIGSTYTYIPQSIGGGASLQKIAGHKYLIFALDYKFTNWSAVPDPAPKVYYNDSHRASAGFQITPNYRTPRNYLQRMAYQVGAFYERSQLRINGSDLSEAGVSLGFNFPLKSRTVIFFSADFGYRGGKNLINENYMKLNLGVSLNEEWFRNWVYD